MPSAQQLRITYRMRLRDEGQGINFSLSKSARLDDWALLCGLDGLDGRKSTRTTSTRLTAEARRRGAMRPGIMHAGGECRRRTGHRHATPSTGLSAPSRPHGRARTRASAISRHCSTRWRRSPSAERWTAARRSSESPRTNRPDVLGWVDRHPDQPAQALLLLLRGEALTAQVDVATERLIVLASNRSACAVPRRSPWTKDSCWPCDSPEGPADPVTRVRVVRPERRSLSAASWPGSAWPLTVCRADGSSQELKPVISDVELEYGALRASLDGPCPEWPELEAAADNPRNRLDHLAPADWRPWLVRLVPCLA